ncbi:MAG: hypothetical protein K2F53_01035, partial [Rikenellaceae bacterium]|nr:hypothetical protein [Rikenellaceae bacterium]
PDDPDKPENPDPSQPEQPDKPTEPENPVPPTTSVDPYNTVEIGGTEWMPVNLANPKQAPGGATFATKLPSQCSGVREESHGKFYQWGINVAWNTTGSSASGATPSGTWNTSFFPSNWTTGPCPDGYRLPTNIEFQALINNSTITRGGNWGENNYGYIAFSNGSNSVEFPAVGYRGTNGGLYEASRHGGYWSSVAGTPNFAYFLYFKSSDLLVGNSKKQDGWSVLCVKDVTKPENPVPPITPVDPAKEIQLTDLIWMKHNLANPKQAPGGATFATKLPSECIGTREESHGKLYQWGINVAWNSTGRSAAGASPSGTWNTSTYSPNWNDGPCPNGYRLPTNTEFQTLTNNSTITTVGGWNSSDYGYIKLTIGSNSVEFPAVGIRYSGGSLAYTGHYGGYWSSVANNSTDAYYMAFYTNSSDVDPYNIIAMGPQYLGNKQYGFSVRCVR